MKFPGLDPYTWSTIQPYVDELLAADLDATGVPAWLSRWSDLSAEVSEGNFRAYRAHTEDTTDPAAEARFMTVIEQIMPEVQKAEQLLKQKLLAADLSQLPAECSAMLRRFRAEVELFRDANIPLQVEVNRLESEFQKIVGAMMVEYNDEQLTMQQLNKFSYDPDRSIREETTRLSFERFLQDRERLNELYLQLLGLRQQIAHNADKANFREYTWQAYGRFDYTPADCQTFHDAIEHEVVPLANRWNKRRREQLGLDSLRPWDLTVDPESRPSLAPFSSADELESGTQRIFNAVDPELGGFFERMRDGYLDLASRPGKAPGGYCGGMAVSKVPYIFMNAVGLHDDVQTMLHEGGHAFHFMESSLHNDLIWNHDAPIEFCEVASMSMELLAAPYLSADKGGFYSDADARRARSEHQFRMLNFLPYMAVVDAFQHWVYVDAPADVTADQLDAQWSALWDRFIPDVDWSGLEDSKVTGWHRKQHIFGAPFYYVEYGLAQLGAWQVWRNSLEDHAGAVQQYRAALRLGNTRTLPELFAAAGAQFAFTREVIAPLVALVNQELEALEA